MALLEMESAARPALPELIAALGSTGGDVRRGAAKVLGGLGIESARALAAEIDRAESRIDRAAAAAALSLIIERVRGQVLYRPETSTAAFDQAVHALLDVVLPPLVELLASSDAGVRREAGRALAQLGPLAAPPLLKSLEHENADVRSSAAEALVRMERYLPDPSPWPANVEGLKQHLVAPLAEAMRQPRFETRLAAIRASEALSLGPYAAELVPLLTAALEDEDASIRRYAAQALSDIQRKPPK
jgi:HEAT repeat protein